MGCGIFSTLGTTGGSAEIKGDSFSSIADVEQAPEYSVITNADHKITEA